VSRAPVRRGGRRGQHEAGGNGTNGHGGGRGWDDEGDPDAEWTPSGPSARA
jgi:hypothetical protein